MKPNTASLDRKSTYNISLVGTTLTVIFTLSTLLLGFFQSEYNHFGDTVSELVIGEYGWIQQVNFVILAAAFALLGYSLGVSLTMQKINYIFGIFMFFTIGALTIVFLPVEFLVPGTTLQFSSLSEIGRIHYISVLLLIILTPILLSFVVLAMRKVNKWSSIIPITILIMIFNFIVGLLWFYLLEFGDIDEFKGLIQKIIILNVLVWMLIVGRKLMSLSKASTENS